MVIMHVFNSSFWLIHNFDKNLYYDPLTVNHLFIFIMSRVVDENKVQLDLAFTKLFQIHHRSDANSGFDSDVLRST